MRNRFLLVLVAIVLVGACGNGEPTSSPVTPPAAVRKDPGAVMAHGYAMERATGYEPTKEDVNITVGLAGIECSEVEPGAEKESHPACIYYVAYEGCTDGVMGTRSGSVEEEFPDEPRLQEIYDQAVEDCSDEG